MQVKITITAETDDPEVLRDAVNIIEGIMPHMFDNVVVTSNEANRNATLLAWNILQDGEKIDLLFFPPYFDADEVLAIVKREMYSDLDGLTAITVERDPSEDQYYWLNSST